MNPGSIYGGMPGQQEMADFAASMAGGVGARSAGVRNTAVPTNVAPVSPANLTAPSSAVVALFHMKPVITARFMFDFQLLYTDSAADTVLSSVSIFGGVTSVSGGTNVGGPAPAPIFTWESSAITVTGGAPVAVPSTQSATFATGNLSQTLSHSGLFVAPGEFWLVFAISATHNLSAMTLSASCGEF